MLRDTPWEGKLLGFWTRGCMLGNWIHRLMTQQKYCDIFLRGLLLANGTSRPSHMKIIGVIAEHRGLNIYGKKVKWSEVTSYIDLRTQTTPMHGVQFFRMRRLWGCLWSDEGNGRRCASRPFHGRIWKMWRSLSPHKTCAFAPPVEKTTKKALKQQNPTVWNVMECWQFSVRISGCILMGIGESNRCTKSTTPPMGCSTA